MCYVFFKLSPIHTGKRESEVVNLFMNEEWERMTELERYQVSDAPKLRKKHKPWKYCKHCNKDGHDSEAHVFAGPMNPGSVIM